MASNDRGYSILLSQLHTTDSRLPLATIQAALSHHLASASPVPTPLAATAISSPYYLTQPFTYEKLQSFSIAFRHASHLKYRNTAKAFKSHSMLRTYLGHSMQAIMAEWVTEVLKGIQGGQSVLTLVASSGLLLGIEDLKIGGKGREKEGIDVGNARWGVEDETIVALAEVMDVYASGLSSSSSSTGIEEWEKEFQPAGQGLWTHYVPMTKLTHAGLQMSFLWLSFLLLNRCLWYLRISSRHSLYPPFLASLSQPYQLLSRGDIFCHQLQLL